ncbi:MAG TPA: ABC transporter substrate-binding protein, partial [Candidatus Limnocylindria bacterium]|nr:ABC transporter substrate-binding protein [Candidatus Limnocylindria bacterium]
GLGLSVVAFLLVMAGAAAQAQEAKKLPRIGVLSASTPSAVAGRIDVFRRGLRELNYVEGKNISIEYRYAEGRPDRLRELAGEVVNLRVDVIVTAGPALNPVVKRATASIPIVMANDSDPVGNGLIVSLARPGGNITGLSTLAPEISGKQLELLKEIIPKLSRAAVIGTSTEPGNAQLIKEARQPAAALGVQLIVVDVKSRKDVEDGFQTAIKERADAVLLLSSAFLSTQRKQIALLAIKNRLPVMSPRLEYVEDGGLVTYGVNINDLFERAAIYVDKILKGARPADLPVEQPTKFEFVITLKAAKQIGLTIPPNVLARADKVIR